MKRLLFAAALTLAPLAHANAISLYAETSYGEHYCAPAPPGVTLEQLEAMYQTGAVNARIQTSVMGFMVSFDSTSGGYPTIETDIIFKDDAACQNQADRENGVGQ